MKKRLYINDESSNIIKHNKIRVLSLFSGAGGLDLGFKKAGFKIVWANDFDRDAVATYKKNVDKNIILGDITKIKNSSFPKNIDVVLGGFPCQGFSIANKNRSINDERNFLYKQLLRVVEYTKPKIFIGENVKGLLSLDNGKVFKMIINDFKKIGYIVNYKIVDASKYGVPQKRERIILFGTRNKKIQLNLTKQKGKNVCDVIGFLKNVPISSKPIKIGNKVIYNHDAYTNVHDTYFGRKNPPNQAEICDYLNYYRKKANLSVSKIDKIFGYKYTAGHWFRKDNNTGSIPKPSDWIKLKKLIKFDNKFDKQVCELVKKQICFEQSLRVTNWNRPSDTITASGPEIHISKKRRLSARECAIIQTFPDNFIFLGKLNSIYRQIGNAVPPLLSFKIANAIKREVFNYDTK